MREMQNEMFQIQLDEQEYMSFLGYKDDENKMNWIKGKEKWGTVRVPDGIETRVHRQFLENGNLEETYSFKNTTEFPVFFKKTDAGIYTTWNDNYEDTDVCLAQRCHTHIFCGEEAAWIMALQMGDGAPHLGLKLKQGSIASYSVERDLSQESNDRGDFILHPVLPVLLPGEETKVVWELFWFADKEEFFEKLLETEGFPVIKARQFSYFAGETIRFEILVQGDVPEQEVQIQLEGKALRFQKQFHQGQTRLLVEYPVRNPGEYRFHIRIKEKKTHAAFFAAPDLHELIEKRCRFLVEKQQYHQPGTPLDGAFLIYDNEEECQYYSHLDDHNGGRERICMGILLARFLQIRESHDLKVSLEKYVKYVYRELYDRDTGLVFNDINRNNTWHRLYNYPWMAVFQLELYRLTKQKEYLQDSFSTMQRYYLEGGKSFYGIGIPATELYSALCAESMNEEAQEFKNAFLEHAEQICKNSIHYPPFEVRYEQSIVAPAVSCLFQAYALTKEEKFLQEAQKQMNVLSLFNGEQPDYHQYETAIRHWDGRWFGKYRNYGDTYPHYWSALTGMAYAQYGEETGKNDYMDKASASFRGCMNLFTKDGRASCAMVYPETVNGKKGHYYDPWANDQDWALYFALKYEEIVKNV